MRLAYVDQLCVVARIVELRRIDLVEILDRLLGIAGDRPELANRRLLAAERAGGVGPKFDFTNARVERVDQHQPPHQRAADSENDLERLARLPRTDDSGERAEHAALRAGGHAAGRWRFGIQTAIARTAGETEDAHLTVEAKDRAVDVGLPF